MQNENNYTYFQYFKEIHIPVYVKCDLKEFDPSFHSFLVQMKFYEIRDKELQKALETLKNDPHSRILEIEPASTIVSRQIEQAAESDRFGPESVIPREGFKVYRYKGMAMMIYSYSYREWKMGISHDFCEKENKIKASTILNRFLSLSLTPLGIVGLWAVPVDEGIVVMRPKDSEGEAIFIDVFKKRIFTIDGIKNLKARFKILRLDPNLKNRNIRMSSDELFSFLNVNTSYFDYQGPSIPVRQMLQSLSRLTEGLIHPSENFSPRADLSIS